MIGRPRVAPEIRFFTRVEQDGDCWIWTGGQTAGYGMFWDGDRNVRAHRWTFEYFRCEIPAGLEIDHLCRRTLCVNPWHGDPVTGLVNILRSDAPSALAARRDHCINGHPLTPGPGQRICRTCRREACSRYRLRIKGVAA